MKDFEIRRLKQAGEKRERAVKARREQEQKLRDQERGEEAAVLAESRAALAAEQERSADAKAKAKEVLSAQFTAKRALRVRG